MPSDNPSIVVNCTFYCLEKRFTIVVFLLQVQTVDTYLLDIEKSILGENLDRLKM